MVVITSVVLGTMWVVVGQFDPFWSIFTILLLGQHPFLDFAHTSTVVAEALVVFGAV